MKKLVFENAEDFLNSLDLFGPILALDLGTKTIGVAVSDSTRTIATPVTIIRRKKFSHDLEEICSLNSRYTIQGIVLGLPINMNGSEGPRCQSTRSFAAKLSTATYVPICLWDERLSTVAAERILIESDISRKSRSKVIDKLAACYILQGLLDRLNYAVPE